MVEAAHDLAEGGLLVAVSEMLFEKPNLGIDLSVDSLGSSNRLDALLFGESQGRVLISVSDDKLDQLLVLAGEKSLPAIVLGSINERGRLKFSLSGNEILDSDVAQLHKIWSDAIPQKMNQN